MKSALGYAVIAVLIGVGVLAYRGDLGNLIGRDSGKAVQETVDKAKRVTTEKAAEAAAVAKDKLSKAKEITAEKVAKATEVAKEKMAEAKEAAVKVKDAAVKKVKEVRQAASDKSANDTTRISTKGAQDPKQPRLTTTEKSPDEAAPESEKTGVIKSAIDAVKNAGSVTVPSPIAWPVVSEEEFNKQRQARLAAAAKSSKSAAKSKKKEERAADDSKTAASTSSKADGDKQVSEASSSDAVPSGRDSASADTASGKMTPYERAKAAPEGSLKNPFDYKDPKVVAEGKKVYLKFSCNGCHGGGGGGGMCPPLTNETWVYGGDDDTLYRLITLGTDELGRSRKGQETVVGPMPPYKDIIKSDEDMWKIIAYIRSVWGGREKKIEW